MALRKGMVAVKKWEVKKSGCQTIWVMVALTEWRNDLGNRFPTCPGRTEDHVGGPRPNGTELCGVPGQVRQHSLVFSRPSLWLFAGTRAEDILLLRSREFR